VKGEDGLLSYQRIIAVDPDGRNAMTLTRNEARACNS
jgi:hypothetical protein